MQLLRTFVVFLVGAGIAIGAHFAGWLNDLPRYWRSLDQGRPVYGGPPYEASIAPPDPSGREIPPDAYVIAQEQQDSASAAVPTVLRVYYSPAGGFEGDRNCPPDYVVLNRTGRMLLFSEAGDEGGAGFAEQARELRVDPGASLSPPDIGPRYAEEAGSDREIRRRPCRSGTVRIVMDGG
ncbi:MAG TPA: hypothetical protein VHC42_01850 [Rhizomicrobium sp.]|nr:hypothetical protein [Rhizomicrobium sp.]